MTDVEIETCELVNGEADAESCSTRKADIASVVAGDMEWDGGTLFAMGDSAGDVVAKTGVTEVYAPLGIAYTRMPELIRRNGNYECG